MVGIIFLLAEKGLTDLQKLVGGGGGGREIVPRPPPVPTAM